MRGWVPILLLAGLVAGVAALARRLAGGAADFEIRLGPGERVEVLGRVPKAKRGAIGAFFREQPGGVPRGQIRGRFGPSGTPRLEFRGAIGPDLRQRARNFLLVHLR